MALLSLLTIVGESALPTFITTTEAATRKKKRTKKRTTSSKSAVISVIMQDKSTGEWIHRGRKKIVIHRDSTGQLRAMAPFSMGAHVARPYADIINKYGNELKSDSVKVYSLIAPSQGEFYMPSLINYNSSQDSTIRIWSEYLEPSVTPVFVCDTLKKHKEEDIYLHTDHHWSPLGAFYAAKVIAGITGHSFLPLEQYQTDTIKNFVGTMHKFSGDKEILKYPEDFIYYIPPGDYEAEFIDYTLKKNKVAATESAPHIAPLFRKTPHGSSAAYATIIGGDNHTVKIMNKKGETGRKVLLVKDSYGNAIAPFLINSFDEVHVIDFRHFPHNLLKYVRKNNITDLIFENCIDIAFTPSTAARLNELFICK